MCDCDNYQSYPVRAKDELKRKSLEAAGLMSRIDMREALLIGGDFLQRP